MLNVRQENIALTRPLSLENGTDLTCTIRYNTYGTRAEDDSNIVLVLHALTGSAERWGNIFVLAGDEEDRDGEAAIVYALETTAQRTLWAGAMFVNPSTIVWYWYIWKRWAFWTLFTPILPSLKGARFSWMQARKCSIWLRSGSAGGMRGLRISPSRTRSRNSP